MKFKDIRPGQLAWVRHPTFGFPDALCRITGIKSQDKNDIEYNWLDIEGMNGACYSAWLDPVSAVEQLVMELYYRTPPGGD